MRPGIVGKQLALQLKSLNAKLWEIYESTALPAEFTNKLRLASASMGWGGRPNDPLWVLGEQDFANWTPSALDKYKSPHDWGIGSPKPHSITLESWRRNALNKSLVFALIYGNIPWSDLPHLHPRRSAIEELYRLHLSNPNKYTLKFIVETWGQLNARWVDTLKESANYLCLLRKVERPTFEALIQTGMSVDSLGGNIFPLHDTFNLSDPSGYFRHQILGALERDFDRARWGQYCKVPAIVPNRNAGSDVQVYGTPLTTKERRICALNSPKTTHGGRHLLGSQHSYRLSAG